MIKIRKSLVGLGKNDLLVISYFQLSCLKNYLFCTLFKFNMILTKFNRLELTDNREDLSEKITKDKWEEGNDII